jgi:hypothetical protein
MIQNYIKRILIFMGNKMHEYFFIKQQEATMETSNSLLPFRNFLTVHKSTYILPLYVPFNENKKMLSISFGRGHIESIPVTVYFWTGILPFVVSKNQ